MSRPGDVWEIEPGVAPKWTKSEHIPSRPPSKLPPPGNEHLSVALGQTIGNGRVGTVHPIKLYTHETDLPPLVVKVSRYKSSESIEKEAWCYEELEQVQGIAVPGCYGLFQVRVEEDMEVLTWTDPRYVKRQKFDPWGRPIEETGDPTLLSILVLERLGERMALRQPDYTAIKTDVYEVYNDLARLGMEHVDFRWSNLLSVLPDSDDASSVCPNHGHAHQWRIVDLDLARKTNCTAEYLELCYDSNLDRMFANLPMGRIIEPWD
ncbi:hypothetical protein Clacol_004217 [Clathrus columnatus]|uniref:Protein kinase domain-containing protein n=1 Tax=Clathrus columnatus TaxID=1419009 RepID=A0AAV5A5S1_9AGAM|nr:hypothetical protein Clacol_004217 [Clathrus columnatus]